MKAVTEQKILNVMYNLRADRIFGLQPAYIRPRGWLNFHLRHTAYRAVLLFHNVDNHRRLQGEGKRKVVAFITFYILVCS